MKSCARPTFLKLLATCGLLFVAGLAVGQTTGDDENNGYQLIQNDDDDDWVEPPPKSEVDAAELRRLFGLYRDALENKAFLEADTLAKRVVEMSIRLNGIDSLDSAKAITNLGIAQHHNRDYESALQNFAASIDIIERIDNRLSSSLINPLQGLAASQAMSGRPDLARLSYRRAVHISQVNDGPHNPGQITTLASMAELNISMGDLKAASNIQKQVFSIQSRKIDPLSLEIIPALENKASWQHRLQRYRDERVTLRQIINVIQRHEGKKSVALIAPLTNLGRSYLFVTPVQFDYHTDVSATTGESYLRRANRIADGSEDATWETVENTLLALGDYYILSGRPNRASKMYAKTWTLLSEGEEQDRLRNRRNDLETVKVLQRVYPPKYYNSVRQETGLTVPENFEVGSTSFSITVAANGRVASLQHIETQPPQLEAFGKVIGRSLRRLLYRPRSVEGKLVPTTDVIYTHEFFYRPSDLKAAVANVVKPASGTETEAGLTSVTETESATETEAGLQSVTETESGTEAEAEAE